MDLACLLSQTERLRLRYLEERDVEDFCGLYCCPRSMQQIGEPLDMAEARRRFHARLDMQQRTLATTFASDDGSGAADDNRSDPVWPWDRPGAVQPVLGVRIVAETLDEGRFAALFGVDCWDTEGNDWELGVMTASSCRGHGYGLEGLRRLTETMLSRGAQRVMMRCRASNCQMSRIARVVGFSSCQVEHSDSLILRWVRTPLAAGCA